LHNLAAAVDVKLLSPYFDLVLVLILILSKVKIVLQILSIYKKGLREEKLELSVLSSGSFHYVS
jgi:hypothetical protein